MLSKCGSFMSIIEIKLNLKFGLRWSGILMLWYMISFEVKKSVRNAIKIASSLHPLRKPYENQCNKLNPV